MPMSIGLCRSSFDPHLTVTESIAKSGGLTPDEVGYYRIRPPIKPITSGELASG